MPMRKFIAALTIGSVPTAFAFAAIGAGWADQPILALAVSYVLPIPPATRRALSHAAASTVRNFNTGHPSPHGLPAHPCRRRVKKRATDDSSHVISTLEIQPGT
jgi:hypothetical protein